MKKIAILLIMSLVAVGTFEQTEVFVGATLGTGLNRLRAVGGANGPESSDILLGINGGVPFEIRFNDYIALQTGLLYAGRGAAFKASDDKILMHTIELPLLAKAGYGKDGKWQVYGITGLKIGSALTAKYINKNFDIREKLDFGGDGELKRGYFGFVAGVGAGFKAGPGKFVVDMTYDVAMTRFIRGNFVLNGDVAQRQRNLNFALSYVFKLGGE